jgi:hypothetical protein
MHLLKTWRMRLALEPRVRQIWRKRLALQMRLPLILCKCILKSS